MVDGAITGVGHRLDFGRLPGPFFDPPRREEDECGLLFPNSGW